MNGGDSQGRGKNEGGKGGRVDDWGGEAPRTTTATKTLSDRGRKHRRGRMAEKPAQTSISPCVRLACHPSTPPFDSNLILALMTLFRLFIGQWSANGKPLIPPLDTVLKSAAFIGQIHGFGGARTHARAHSLNILSRSLAGSAAEDSRSLALMIGRVGGGCRTGKKAERECGCDGRGGKMDRETMWVSLSKCMHGLAPKCHSIVCVAR